MTKLKNPLILIGGFFVYNRIVMKNKKNIFLRLVENIEAYIPMTFSSLIIFLIIIYLFVVVGRTIATNYESNKQILIEAQTVAALEVEVGDIQNKINYYRTSSFKEKEAREKLGYKAPGENVISLPIDQENDKVSDSSISEVKIKTPNYRYWWSYFFE